MPDVIKLGWTPIKERREYQLLTAMLRYARPVNSDNSDNVLVWSQAAQAHYVWARASEVIWSEYTRIITVLSYAK